MREKLFKEGWLVLCSFLDMVYFNLKLHSEHAAIVVVQAAQVDNTDVDLVDFAALENSVN